MSETEKSAAKTVIETLKLNSLSKTDEKTKIKIEKDKVSNAKVATKSVEVETKSENGIKTENKKNIKKIEFNLEEPTQANDPVPKAEKIETKDEQISETNQVIDKPQSKPRLKKKLKPVPATPKEIKPKSDVKDNNVQSGIDTDNKPEVKPEMKPTETQKATTLPSTVKDTEIEKNEVVDLAKLSVKPKKKPKLKIKPDVQPKIKADMNVEMKMEVKPMLDPDISNSESNINSESGIYQEQKSFQNPKASVAFKTKPEVEPEVKQNNVPVLKPAKSDAEPQADSEIKQDKKSKPKPKAKVAVKQKSEVEPGPEVKLEIKPEVKLEAEPVIESEFVIKNELKTEPFVEPEVKIGKPKPKVKPKIKPKVNSDIETNELEMKGEPSPISPTESEVKQMEAKPEEDKIAKPEVKRKVEGKEKTQIQPEEKTHTEIKPLTIIEPKKKSFPEFQTAKNDFKNEIITELQPEKAAKDKPKKKPKPNPKTEVSIESKLPKSPTTTGKSDNATKTPPEHDNSGDSKKDKTPKKKGIFGGIFKSKKKNTKTDSLEPEVERKKLTSKERKKIEREQQKAEKLEAKKRKKLEKEQKKSKKNDQNDSDKLESGKTKIDPTENSELTTKKMESGDISASPKIPSKPPRTPSSIKRQKEREAKEKLDENKKIETEQKVDSESKAQENNDDFESKVKSEAKSAAKPEVGPKVEPKMKPEAKPDVKPEVESKVNLEEKLAAEIKVEKDQKREDISDFNEIPDNCSMTSDAVTSKLQTNQEFTTESSAKAEEEIKSEVNAKVEPESTAVVEEKIKLDLKSGTDINLEVDESPDFNDLPEELKKTESRNSQIAQPEVNLQVKCDQIHTDAEEPPKEKETESKAPNTEDSVARVVAVESHIVPKTVRKQSFSSEDSDDGSLFDFSDDDDIETAIKLNLSEKLPLTVATKISTSESLKQEIQFELVEKKPTFEQTPESNHPSDEANEDNLPKENDEEFPNFNEVPEENEAKVSTPVSPKNEDFVNDSKARKTEGSFILKNDQHQTETISVEDSNNLTETEIPDFNDLPEKTEIQVETTESLPDADNDSFIGSDESIFDENIRFSDEDDSDDIPARYSQDQIITPRNSGDDNIELDEHHDSFNVGTQPEFRFSQGSTTEPNRTQPINTYIVVDAMLWFVDPWL